MLWSCILVYNLFRYLLCPSLRYLWYHSTVSFKNSNFARSCFLLESVLFFRRLLATSLKHAELAVIILVLEPTSATYPSISAMLFLTTKSWASISGPHPLSNKIPPLPTTAHVFWDVISIPCCILVRFCIHLMWPCLSFENLRPGS